MKTFWVQTLGCKVNHYESEQIATLLRARGLVETASAAEADLRVVNTCSVTTEAASKSRQTTRRMIRLPLLQPAAPQEPAAGGLADVQYNPTTASAACGPASNRPPLPPPRSQRQPRVIVTGCWATSDRAAAEALPGVDAVLTHHGDVAAELDRLLFTWRNGDSPNGPGRSASDPAFHGGPASADTPNHLPASESPPEPWRELGWMIKAGSPAGARTWTSKADSIGKVNAELRSERRAAQSSTSTAVPSSASPASASQTPGPAPATARGTTALPLLGQRQAGRQRAFLKVQDGCDAHCTYCIIPTLRPIPWSKPVDDVVEEARRLVAAGHVEIVLTGIFLGAYGQPTALRRRQPVEPARHGPLGELVRALCTRVEGLRRLRLSSLEPGDLTDGLVAVLRDHEQVVPHFHLPLQSGSDAILRRMNRQYGRDDFLRMLDRVNAAFDRPALTTDVIVGFPGETDEEFRRTVEVVDAARFIHVHAFPFSPRPGTAAARWKKQSVPGHVASQRIGVLTRRADDHSFAFRQQFLGEVVEVLVEHDAPTAPTRHGRCERYFDVRLREPSARPGDFVRVRVDRVTPSVTEGEVV